MRQKYNAPYLLLIDYQKIRWIEIALAQDIGYNNVRLRFLAAKSYKKHG